MNKDALLFRFARQLVRFRAQFFYLRGALVMSLVLFSCVKDTRSMVVSNVEIVADSRQPSAAQ